MARRERKAPTVEEFAAAGVPSARLERLSVELCRKSKNKWHLRGASCAAAWTDARYDTEALPLLGLDWSAVCKSCAASVDVPPEAEATIAAVETLSRVRRWVDEFESQPHTTPVTWLTYARLAEHRPWAAHRGGVPDLAADLRGQRAWSATARAIRAQTATLAARIDVVVANFRSRAPHNEMAGWLTRARAEVFDSTPVSEESTRVQRIGGWQQKSEQSLPAWNAVADEWEQGKRRGDEPDQTSAAALAPLEARMPHVHDLALLPDDHEIAAGPNDCLHTWARRAFSAHLESMTRTWVERLEQAYAAVAGENDPEEVALLVKPWPLTRNEDAELSFLAQFPVILEFSHVVGKHLPYDYSGRHSYRWNGSYCTWPARPAVIRVPRSALDHAAAVAPSLRDAATPLTGQSTYEQTAADLLRSVGFNPQPTDFPDRPAPSALVSRARAALAEGSNVPPRYGHQIHRPFAPGSSPALQYPGDDREWEGWRALRALTCPEQTGQPPPRARSLTMPFQT